MMESAHVGGDGVPSGVSVYVLTIEQEPARRHAHAAAELRRAQLAAEYVQGLRGDDPRLDGLYARWLNRLLFKRPLSRGELAVYAGHRLIWARIAASPHEFALVLEDDFRIVDDGGFSQAIADALRFRRRWDILKLFDYRPKRIVLSERFGRTNAVAYKYPSSGAVAYLITREAARRLLRRRGVFRPVDEDMSHMWEFGVRIWSVHPNPVAEWSDGLGGSLIDVDRARAKQQVNAIRSLWGNLLQGGKLVRSLGFRRRMRDVSGKAGSWEARAP